MGVGASGYVNSCSPRFGGSSQSQHTLIGTGGYGQQGYGCEPKLYSLEPQGPDRPLERRKKGSSLATLRRRFIKRRKSGRSADHARQMRELLSGWEVRDVAALVEEYEGTAALKELSFLADLARPEARTLRRDLGMLYERRHCSDVDLVFQGVCFPVHRAILAARCPLFRKLLPSSSSSPSEHGGEVLMDVALGGVDAPAFSALLRYLYTGELATGDARSKSTEILLRLSEEFGTPNPLEADMRGLCDRMCYYDSLLSFSAEAAGGGEELRAHKALLSARSPFFRNLLQRRTRSGEETGDSNPPPGPTRIVLDESIIPKKYARVILHCMYTDMVDLSLVLRTSPSAGSLGEVQALVAGRGGASRTEEAMELYHIALFLEFSMLAQGCEDIVAESISLETVVSILRWSSQPYGSKWVHRRALHFLWEEFGHVMTSDTLYELSQEHLLEAIQSDYLQASEQDVLKYLVKWGEHQLMKRMADREPNLLSGTAHSVNKRGVKRRDLDLEELKEILSPLLPCVRAEHILPANSEVLSDAMKRGLVSTPPSDMLPPPEEGRANAWLRMKSPGIHPRPRLFSPYMEEAKAVLDELMVDQTDLARLRMVRMSNVPDTLYMVNNTTPQCCHFINHQPITGGQGAPPSVVANEIPVPRLAVVKRMMARLQELRHTDLTQRAYGLNCGEGSSVSRALQLRVLREVGLPDGAVELLQNPHKFFPDECFGDESPVLALRPVSGVTTAEGLPGFRPPPPYHPPTTPGHAHCRPRPRPQPPSRSLSYPCNHASLPWRHAHKQAEPTGPTHPPYPGQQGMSRVEAAGVSQLMPDVAVGVSSLTLRGPQMCSEGEIMDPPPTHYPPGLYHTGRRGHAPDLYALPRHAPLLQPCYATGPDLYGHVRLPTGPAPVHGSLRLRHAPRPDLAPPDPRGRAKTEPPPPLEARPLTVAVETQRPMPTEGAGPGGDEVMTGRDRRSPSKPEYQYRKSAL